MAITHHFIYLFRYEDMRVLLISLLFIHICSAAEVQETFVIDIFDDFVRVVSPEKMTNKMKVIVNNRTLSKLYGHIQSPGREWISYFSLGSEKTKSFPIKNTQFDKFILFSQSPPFQEVWLIPGKSVYEIPPKDLANREKK